MTFNSLAYCVFLPVVVLLYHAISHRWQNRMLLVASYVFYSAWDWRFSFLMLASTVIDHRLGIWIAATASPEAKKRWITGSIVVNLSILGVFKYFGFFIDSFVQLLAALEIHASRPALEIVLPIGISFYTFQSMSYTIDVYRGRCRVCPSLADFALYVALFPQLVAGPIERATHLLPQVIGERHATSRGIDRGLFLILYGLFKKVAISDAIAPMVDRVYASTGETTGAEILVATWLFAIQIYCDFSGYSDIARGSAKLLGFDLMRNFDLPYFSANPQEFWRRWHISLSQWLRDYVYVPLGGNRFGGLMTHRNLILTMVLGGAWHGAAWNFVLWGTFQGLLLAGHRAVVGRLRDAPATARESAPLLSVAKALLFFQVTCYGWVLFRARSLEQIVHFTSLLAGSSLFAFSTLDVGRLPFSALAGLPLLLALDIAERVTGRPAFYELWPTPLRAALYVTLCIVTLLGTSNAPSQFIYFQF